MRKSRFTEEQIVGILKEVEKTGKTGEIIRRHGISRETFYRWRRKYGGLSQVGHVWRGCRHHAGAGGPYVLPRWARSRSSLGETDMIRLRRSSALIVVLASSAACQRSYTTALDYASEAVIYGNVTQPSGVPLVGATVKTVARGDSTCALPTAYTDTVRATTDGAGRFRARLFAISVVKTVCIHVLVTPPPLSGLGPISKLVPNAARMTISPTDSVRINMAY